MKEEVMLILWGKKSEQERQSQEERPQGEMWEEEKGNGQRK